MPQTNFDRLVQLAEEVFAIRSDPSQLNVDQEVIERLLRIHPASVSEQRDDEGPVAWLLLFPTTLELMDRFLEGSITEKQLFQMTPEQGTYDAIYLCSALVLEEYRRKGIIRKLALDAIESMRADHPIKVLFTWAFTPEGEFAAESIALSCGLPLLKR